MQAQGEGQPQPQPQPQAEIETETSLQNKKRSLEDESERQHPKKACSNGFQEVVIDDDMEIPSDTELAIQTVQGLVTRQVSNQWSYKFVFQNQIYGILSDKAIVDRELEIIRKENKFKFLHYSDPSSVHALSAIIDKEEYIQDIRKFIISSDDTLNNSEKEELIDRFTDWVNSSTLFNINRNDLIGIKATSLKSLNAPNNSSSSSSSAIYLEESPFQSDDIDHLIRIGFLRLKHGSTTKSFADQLLWLTHPMLGSAVNFMRQAESTILTWLRRTRYKEIPEKDMCLNSNSNSNSNITAKKKNNNYRLKGSPFGVNYHILDMCGKHVIKKVFRPATQDYIIRLER